MDSIKEIKKISLIKPKYIIFIASAMALILISSALFEFNENKKEVYHLLNENASALIHIVDNSSVNSILSESEYEKLLTVKLIGVAKNISRLETITTVTNSTLETIADENEIFRINIFDKSGKKILSNMEGDAHQQSTGKYLPKDMLEPILEGKQDVLVMGLKSARMEKGTRFAVAVARKVNEGGAIVVNLDANFFMEFRKKTGIQKLISDLAKYSGIEYILLQDTSGILYSSKNLPNIDKINESDFLKSAYFSNKEFTRIYNYDSKNVYEITKSFAPGNIPSGIFRIALSMDEIKMLENRMINRYIIISVILIIISVIVIGIIISNQNFNILSGKYSRIKTLSESILADMNQGVITVNKDNIIEVFNDAAKSIFEVSTNLNGKNINDTLNDFPDFKNIILNKKEISNSELSIETKSNRNKILSLNSVVKQSEINDFSFFTVVITDITEIKKLEQRKNQDEKLLAMGELASSVAHEIRNPLNSINMISQRFEKEFSDKLQSGKFVELSNILKSESGRVNKIIEDFLKYARPPRIQKLTVNSDDFLNDIDALFKLNMKSDKIKFEIIKKCSEKILIDTSLIKQALFNLLKNSYESITNQGFIILEFSCLNNKIVFTISDNGSGIDDNEINKIYNLYYTTKQNGTGLGLSIVRQIIQGHNGTMNITSKKNKGTTVELIIPK